MLSRHARKRMQQRGVPYAVVDILLDFGRAEHDGHGGEIIYLDSNDRRVARPLFREFGIGDHCLNAYLVVGSNGNVLTIGHRYVAIKHH